MINHFGGNFQSDGRSIISDSEGNFIFCGNFNKSINFKDTTLNAFGDSAYGKNELVFGKMDPSGNVLWVHQIGGFFNHINGVSNIEIDDLNNIYIYANNLYGSNLGDTIVGNQLILKYSKNGKRLFILQIFAGEIYDFHEKYNSIYLTGTNCKIKNGFDTIQISGNFILNLSNEGSYNWHTTTNKKNYKFEIAKDSSIYLYSKILLDSASGIGSPTRLFFDKTDKFGNLKLSRYFDGSGFANISDMFLNKESLFLTGYYFGTLNFSESLIDGLADCFLVRLDTDINVKYANRIINYNREASNLKIKADNNNCYFVGNLSGFYSGTVLNESKGYNDNFVVKYDSIGNEAWHIQFGGTADFDPSDLVGDISITPQGKLLFAGSFSGQITINNSIVTSTSFNYEDMLFLQFDIPTLINSNIEKNNIISVYPNPCISILNFSNSKYSFIKIFDETGTLVLQTKKNEIDQNINMESFEDGIYIYEIISDHGQILQVGKILHLKNNNFR